MSTRAPATRNTLNATARANSRGIERDPGGPIIKAATISFTNPATISDSGSGLGNFTGLVGSTVRVEGSASNNREYTITAATTSALTTAEQVVTTESAGATVTIVQSDS